MSTAPSEAHRSCNKHRSATQQMQAKRLLHYRPILSTVSTSKTHKRGLSERLKDSCHCGAVGFTVALSDGLRNDRRCTYSFCRMRVAVSARLSGVDIQHGADVLTEYRLSTEKARHCFCSVCGIDTHHQRCSTSEQYSVNLFRRLQSIRACPCGRLRRHQPPHRPGRRPPDHWIPDLLIHDNEVGTLLPMHGAPAPDSVQTPCPQRPSRHGRLAVHGGWVCETTQPDK